MSYLTHFENELQELRKGMKEGGSLVIEPFIPEITAIINKASEQGWSGAYAALAIPIISNSIKNALLFKPLAPIEDNPEGWVKSEWSESSYHKRLGSLWKDEGGKPHYNEALSFTINSGGWHGRFKTDRGDIGSSLTVKKWPFHPKTFHIKLLEVDKGEEEENFYIILNPEIFKEVAEIYELPENFDFAEGGKTDEFYKKLKETWENGKGGIKPEKPGIDIKVDEVLNEDKNINVCVKGYYSEKEYLKALKEAKKRAKIEGATDPIPKT